MTGRGHRAAMPPAGHAAEQPLSAHGLTVTVVNHAGHPRQFDFALLPAAEPVQRALAAAFAAQSRRWTSHQSAVAYWRAARTFAQFLAGLEHPPQDLDELTPAMLKRWRQQFVHTGTGRHTMSLVRVLLRRDPRLAEGPAADEVARRIPERKSGRQSYGEPERRQVLIAARQQFRSAWLRIRENAGLLEAWRAGELAEGSDSWRLGKVLDCLARTGDVPRSASGHVTAPALLGGTRADKTWGRLFMTRGEVTALAVLLTDQFGWNLSVYNRMPAPTAMPSAGETMTVTYQVTVEKRRAGQGRWFSTENITDTGADSGGRLITQALQATAPGRALAARLAPGTDLLMTARTTVAGRARQDPDTPLPAGPLVFGVSGDTVKHWVRSHNLPGSPFQRLRRTTVTREGRPLQHAQGTHESVYVLPDARIQHESRKVFADGACEALEQARSAVFGGVITAGTDPSHQQTATADCADAQHSPWPAADGSCAADFLLCLACPNAHVHPGHHPRLAHLHQRVLSLRSALPDAMWKERWSGHLLRLEDLRRKVGMPAWDAALRRVLPSDRVIIGALLNGELAP